MADDTNSLRTLAEVRRELAELPERLALALRRGRNRRPPRQYPRQEIKFPKTKRRRAEWHPKRRRRPKTVGLAAGERDPNTPDPWDVAGKGARLVGAGVPGFGQIEAFMKRLNAFYDSLFKHTKVHEARPYDAAMGAATGGGRWRPKVRVRTPYPRRRRPLLTAEPKAPRLLGGPPPLPPGQPPRWPGSPAPRRLTAEPFPAARYRVDGGEEKAAGVLPPAPPWGGDPFPRQRPLEPPRWPQPGGAGGGEEGTSAAEILREMLREVKELRRELRQGERGDEDVERLEPQGAPAEGGVSTVARGESVPRPYPALSAEGMHPGGFSAEFTQRTFRALGRLARRFLVA